MSERQQLRRLLIVNSVTACVMATGLALEGMSIPAACVLLLTFSTVGTALWFDRNKT